MCNYTSPKGDCQQVFEIFAAKFPCWVFGPAGEQGMYESTLFFRPLRSGGQRSGVPHGTTAQQPPWSAGSPAAYSCRCTQMTVSQTLTAIQQSIFATQLGLSPEEKTNLLSSAKLEPVHVEFDADGNRIQGTDYSGLRQVIATVLIVMIWIFVATYGSIVAQEIASEKGTRIMEVILSSVKAETHFYGKLVGIILVCSVNVLAYAVQIGVGYLIFRDNDMMRSFLNGLNLQEVFTGQFWLVIPIVILGILLFTFLAALSGSLISRVEDVPKAQTPMTMIGLLGYMLSVIFASQPDNIVMTVTSYIPFISSFVLPMQIATGVASNLQVWISMGIMFVTMLFILLFSARLYKSNVLIYSSDGLLKVLKQSLNNIKNEDKLKNKA